MLLPRSEELALFPVRREGGELILDKTLRLDCFQPCQRGLAFSGSSNIAGHLLGLGLDQFHRRVGLGLKHLLA
jgi:hypothetical protein